MKLHKQTKLKAEITTLIAALMLGFMGLVRADPAVDADGRCRRRGARRANAGLRPRLRAELQRNAPGSCFEPAGAYPQPGELSMELDHTFWYLTRASGFVAYLLLFASLVLGLSMTGNLSGRSYRRSQVYDLHRFLSLFTLGFTVFHILIVLPDRYIGFSLVELLVPFASPYRPEFMALGILSLMLMAIAVGSFYARELFGYRMWRVLHYVTFAVFISAAAHGIGAGTDSGTAWAPYIYAATGLAVFNLTVYRVLKGSSRGLPASSRTVAPEEPARVA